MKFGSFVYLPPRHLPYAEPFYENILHYKHSWPLFLFSDQDWEGAHPIKDPELVKLAREDWGPVKHYAVSNVLFLTALRMAHQNGITHMLYLEADCRVGRNGWDDAICYDFQHASREREILNAGFIMLWNPTCGGLATKRAFDEAMFRWLEDRSQTAPEIYHDRVNKPCAYANGCGSVIDVEWAVKAFGIADTVLTAMRSGPWDLEIGRKLWAEFGPAAFSKVAHLPSVFSTYGDGSSTEAQRIEMLRDGKVALVHHVKSNIAYP